MKIIFKMIVLLVLILLPLSAFANDFEILSFNVKEIKESSLFKWFSIKIDIRNGNKPGEIYITLKALDNDGFEIKSVTLSGEFGANQVRTLTTKTALDKNLYDNFREWTIYEAKKFENPGESSDDIKEEIERLETDLKYYKNKCILPYSPSSMKHHERMCDEAKRIENKIKKLKKSLR